MKEYQIVNVNVSTLHQSSMLFVIIAGQRSQLGMVMGGFRSGEVSVHLNSKPETDSDDNPSQKLNPDTRNLFCMTQGVPIWMGHVGFTISMILL